MEKLLMIIFKSVMSKIFINSKVTKKLNIWNQLSNDYKKNFNQSNNFRSK